MVSIIQGRDGATVEGDVTTNPGAASDEGFILRNTGLRLDQVQLIVTGSDFVRDSCTTPDSH